VAKAGSKVVKNVAGYDLSKLFTGSLGTLGLIAEANFRLHPIRDVSRTVVAEIEGGPQEVHAAANAVVRTQAEPTAIELRYDGDEKLISVLLESIEGGIDAKVETISHVLGAHGNVRDAQDGDHLGDTLPEMRKDDALVKVAAPPAELAAVLDSVLGAAERKGLEHPRITGHAGTGGDAADKTEVVEELREIWGRRGGSVVLLSAPRELKERAGVWGAPRDDMGLMGRVKDKFDSRGIMNPGRFVGGI
jgi:glycolate oxidase FAD binding subunit